MTEPMDLDEHTHGDEQHAGSVGNMLNWLRAGVLGANDGIVSTAGLVMGVAGATTDRTAIFTAGAAGLVAGALSMAGGEYVSVSTQRDTERALLNKERWELRNMPDEELEELAGLYQQRGLSPELARQVAEQLTAHDALAAHAEVELGIDPDELGGSAAVAAGTSFVLFAIGAMIPILPFIFLSGTLAAVLSAALCTLGLFGIGALITLLTGRSVLFSGMRQVLIGLGAAALTFGIGRLIGAAVG
jgi:VIT1/CCC1 family predicted Fe2+/Mn2+ transporter